LGADIEMSDRGSLTRGLTEFVDRLMFEEASIVSKFFGPFGSVGDRFFSELMRNTRPFSLGMHDIDALDVVSIPTSTVLGTISSFSNVEKAVIMNRLGVILDRKGNPIARDNYKLSEEIAKAIGFQHTDEQLVWDLKKRRDYDRKINNNIVDAAVQLMNEHAIKLNTIGVSPEEQARYDQDLSFLMSLGVTPADNMEIVEGIRRRLLAKDRKSEAINEYITKQLIHAPLAELDNIRATLIGNKIIRTGVFDNENEE